MRECVCVHGEAQHPGVAGSEGEDGDVKLAIGTLWREFEVPCPGDPCIMLIMYIRCMLGVLGSFFATQDYLRLIAAFVVAI